MLLGKYTQHAHAACAFVTITTCMHYAWNPPYVHPSITTYIHTNMPYMQTYIHTCSGNNDDAWIQIPCTCGAYFPLPSFLPFFVPILQPCIPGSPRVGGVTVGLLCWGWVRLPCCLVAASARVRRYMWVNTRGKRWGCARACCGRHDGWTGRRRRGERKARQGKARKGKECSIDCIYGI